MAIITQESNSSGNQNFCTPKEIYGNILKILKKRNFDLDPCCSKKNIPALNHFIENEKDGLKERWEGEVLLNPPFKLTKDFVKKAYLESRKDNCNVWAILPADRKRQKYYQQYVLRGASFCFFVEDRVKFILDDVELEWGYRHDLCIAYYSSNKENVKEVIKEWNKKELISGTMMLSVN